MLKPLDPEKLAALLSAHDTAGCGRISSARLQLSEEGDMRSGVLSLLEINPSTFEARISYEEDDIEIWYICFRDSPFRSLRLVPASKNAIDIYAFGKCVKTFVVLGCPHNWVSMLLWLWDYGHERQVVKVKNGSMLPLLDSDLYNAVASQDDDAGSSLLRQAHYYFANKDVAEALYMLLVAFQLCSPQLYREATNPENWHISFKESPLRTLRIQPSNDCLGTAIYAFDKRVALFRVIDSPPRGPLVSDLESRQRMLGWIWDYGNRRIEGRLKYKAKQSNSNSKIKAKRTEIPLLHKVLHSAGFKAHYTKLSRRKTVKLELQQEEDIMEDIGEVNSDTHSEEPLSLQLFGQKAPLRAADPNAQLGAVSKAKDTENDQTAKFRVESVNIGGLKILDYQR